MSELKRIVRAELEKIVQDGIKNREELEAKGWARTRARGHKKQMSKLAAKVYQNETRRRLQ